MIEQAPTLTEYLFQTVLPQGPASSFEAKMGALERLRPIATVLPVGLMRSAFFGAMSQRMGLPASELESTLRSKQPLPVKAVPKPGAAPVDDKPPEQWEALFGAAVLRDKRLLGRDERGVRDELRHTGLRNLIAALAGGGSPEDALYEASEPLKNALRGAQLPGDEQALEQAFATVCRRLKLRGIEDQLIKISQLLAKSGATSELSDESRELLTEQSQLLALKRAIQAEKG
jgi:DNA primase